MIVYVEKKVLEDPAIVSDGHFGPVKKKFCTFREGRSPWGCALWDALGKHRCGHVTPAHLCPQITMTFPTRLTSSSAWGAMAPCSMPPPSSR